jgi:hypothetical protein
MSTKNRSSAYAPPNMDESSYASVVFDGGIPSGDDGLFANSNFMWLAAASKFALASRSIFNGMSWWGGYAFTGIAGAEDDFTLDIFDVVNGLPGSRVHSVRLGGGNRLGTGKRIGGLQIPEYHYSANFADISLEAGTYFTSLSNRYAGTGIWFWETTVSGQQMHGSASYNLDELRWELADRGNRIIGLAFQLTYSRPVTEASRIALLGLALARLMSTHCFRRPPR